MRRHHIWALEWYSRNRLDGETRHLIHENLLPVLFRTRADAREFTAEKYGYLKKEGWEYLKYEPFGWRTPRPVRVEVKVK